MHIHSAEMRGVGGHKTVCGNFVDTQHAYRSAVYDNASTWIGVGLVSVTDAGYYSLTMSLMHVQRQISSQQQQQIYLYKHFINKQNVWDARSFPGYMLF